MIRANLFPECKREKYEEKKLFTIFLFELNEH